MITIPVTQVGTGKFDLETYHNQFGVLESLGLIEAQWKEDGAVNDTPSILFIMMNLETIFHTEFSFETLQGILSKCGYRITKQTMSQRKQAQARHFPWRYTAEKERITPECATYSDTDEMEKPVEKLTEKVELADDGTQMITIKMSRQKLTVIHAVLNLRLHESSNRHYQELINDISTQIEESDIRHGIAINPKVSE